MMSGCRVAVHVETEAIELDKPNHRGASGSNGLLPVCASGGGDRIADRHARRKQQYLSVACGPPHRPDFLFPDEVAASLNEKSEARLNAQLCEALPGAA